MSLAAEKPEGTLLSPLQELSISLTSQPLKQLKALQITNMTGLKFLLYFLTEIQIPRLNIRDSSRLL